MPFAELGDVRLFFTDEGEGDPPVLMVHGWTCDSHDWTFQIPDFTARHRVIAADIRGHGRSTTTTDGYTPRSFAADLAGLLEQLGTAPVVAMGHSLGGLIVSALAVEHPHLVRAVVAVDPAYGVEGDARSLLLGILGGLRSPAGYDVTAAAFAGMEVASTPPALATWHRRRAVGLPLEVITDTLAGIYEPDDQFGLRPQSDEYLARRNCPVLAVYAGEQRGRWESSVFQDPHSRLVMWDGVGHWLHQERPEEFNSLVLDWIAGLSD